MLGELTVWINYWEDVEVILVQERLSQVVTRLVTIDELLSDVFESL